MSSRGPQPDRVDFELVMEMVDMLIGSDHDFEEASLAVGVSHSAMKRYQKLGVPRYVAEALYDRIALGLGPRKLRDVWKEAS